VILPPLLFPALILVMLCAAPPFMRFLLTGLRCSVGVTSQEFVTSYEDSVEVALMRKSGAIPICSTNATELGIWDQSYKTFFAVVEDHNT
jgi:Asp-tRNA(Asn)/Glu-tRNA(Gln) amidotransferase A subunit family amidase